MGPRGSSISSRYRLHALCQTPNFSLSDSAKRYSELCAESRRDSAQPISTVCYPTSRWREASGATPLIQSEHFSGLGSHPEGTGSPKPIQTRTSRGTRVWTQNAHEQRGPRIDPKEARGITVQPQGKLKCREAAHQQEVQSGGLCLPPGHHRLLHYGGLAHQGCRHPV